MTVWRFAEEIRGMIVEAQGRWGENKGVKVGLRIGIFFSRNGLTNWEGEGATKKEAHEGGKGSGVLVPIKQNVLNKEIPVSNSFIEDWGQLGGKGGEAARSAKREWEKEKKSTGRKKLGGGKWLGTQRALNHSGRNGWRGPHRTGGGAGKESFEKLFLSETTPTRGDESGERISTKKEGGVRQKRETVPRDSPYLRPRKESRRKGGGWDGRPGQVGKDKTFWEMIHADCLWVLPLIASWRGFAEIERTGQRTREHQILGARGGIN